MRGYPYPQPNNPLGLTAHSAGFVGYSRRFLLWAAAQRERSASSDKECAVPIGLQSMRSFDMDIFRLHTGAPWPLCGLSMAISWLSWGEQVHSLLSEYPAEYPAILDIATYLSLNKLFGRAQIMCSACHKRTSDSL
jgi:hypothetical protein